VIPVKTGSLSGRSEESSVLLNESSGILKIKEIFDREGGNIMKPKIILAIVIFVLMLILTIQNIQTVSFRFLFWSLTISRILLIPLFILLDFVLGYIVAKWERPSKNQKLS
jgi:uncharacterized integral membrane protein